MSIVSLVKTEAVNRTRIVQNQKSSQAWAVQSGPIVKTCVKPGGQRHSPRKRKINERSSDLSPKDSADARTENAYGSTAAEGHNVHLGLRNHGARQQHSADGSFFTPCFDVRLSSFPARPGLASLSHM